MFGQFKPRMVGDFLRVLSQSPNGVMWDGADTTALNGLMKDVYEDAISEGVNNSFPLKDFFKTETADYKGGEGHTWTAHVGRNVSPMFVGEDSAFASAGNQQHKKGSIQCKKLMARIRMTEEAMEDLVSSEASFRNGMTDEKTRLIDDVNKRIEFALGTDGKGVFGLLAGDPGTTSTTTEMDSPGNIANTAFGNRFIQKGMYLAAVNPATGAIRAGIQKVVDVNTDGTDYTADAAANAAWADNDYIVQAANGSVTDILDTSYEKAFWGLPALIDDGTNRDNYFGISRTVFPNYKSYVSASTGAFSLDAAQRTGDVVNQKLGGEITDIVMHHSTRRLYIQLLEADRRYLAASLMKPDGGTAAFKQGDLEFGQVNVKAIRSVGLDQVYFLDRNKSGFKKYVANAGQWVDRDGSIWKRDGTGTSARHAYEAWYYMRQQYFCTNPGYNARWDGVTGQTLVVVRDE
jgi:hypothetical protein